jgi:hypothetical protein
VCIHFGTHCISDRYCYIHITLSVKVSDDTTVDKTEGAPLRDTLLVVRFQVLKEVSMKMATFWGI